MKAAGDRGLFHAASLIAAQRFPRTQAFPQVSLNRNPCLSSISQTALLILASVLQNPLTDREIKTVKINHKSRRKADPQTCAPRRLGIYVEASNIKHFRRI